MSRCGFAYARLKPNASDRAGPGRYCAAAKAVPVIADVH
jgi:hypothetical protein